jgi:bifunctional enzyme CysN/CysC
MATMGNDYNMREDVGLKESQLGCYWFSGLSGAGKTTLANWMKSQLEIAGIRCVVLDGDEIRRTLNSDLKFDRESRRENSRRIAAVAKMFFDSGSVVLVSTIAPYAEDRAHARACFGAGEFFEVYVTTPFEACKKRDPKGLYAGLSAAVSPNFTGHDAPYEPPEHPEFRISTEGRSVAESGAQMVRHIVSRFSGGAVGHATWLEECRDVGRMFELRR